MLNLRLISVDEFAVFAAMHDTGVDHTVNINSLKAACRERALRQKPTLFAITSDFLLKNRTPSTALQTSYAVCQTWPQNFFECAVSKI